MLVSSLNIDSVQLAKPDQIESNFPLHLRISVRKSEYSTMLLSFLQRYQESLNCKYSPSAVTDCI